MARAKSSLPVPLSPSTSTFAVDGAACHAISSAPRSAGELPTMGRDLSWLSSAFSVLFSLMSAWRSRAFCTLLTIETRLSGFSTKS